MSTNDELRQQLIDARKQQMVDSLERLWQLNLGERPPAGGLNLRHAEDVMGLRPTSNDENSFSWERSEASGAPG